MATQGAIDELRANIGDEAAEDDQSDAFYADATLAAFLDAVDGSEPRARVAALRPMVAQAARSADFTDGDYSEKAQQIFKNLSDLLAAAQAEVAVLDEQDAATVAGKARLPVRVPVQYWF